MDDLWDSTKGAPGKQHREKQHRKKQHREGDPSPTRKGGAAFLLFPPLGGAK
jgi:hypothetical protein